MKKLVILLVIILPNFLEASDTDNYLNYHKEIIRAEEYIVKKQFAESLKIYRLLSEEYEHLFLRDCKVAAQLAAYTGDAENLFFFLERGMKKGWTLKEIIRNRSFKKFKYDKRWAYLESNQDRFKENFYQGINTQLRTEIRKMFVKDQKRALRVALTPIKKWRERYTKCKFVPNNRVQVRRINKIIDQFGYPGEKIIGDKSWATVIISHNEHDTIYYELESKLYSAFERGEISPIDLAIIETWRTGVNTGWKDKSFIIFKEQIGVQEATHADSLRQSIGLRNIELNNKLIQIQNELKMNFYLSPFHGGLITIKE